MVGIKRASCSGCGELSIHWPVFRVAPRDSTPPNSPSCLLVVFLHCACSYPQSLFVLALTPLAWLCPSKQWKAPWFNPWRNHSLLLFPSRMGPVLGHTGSLAGSNRYFGVGAEKGGRASWRGKPIVEVESFSMTPVMFQINS